jgi:hypothetical protein
MHILTASKSTRIKRFPLAGNHSLVVERPLSELSKLHIVGSGGEAVLSLEITPAGAVLRFEGAALTIQAGRNLRLQADTVAIHATEGLAITSGGDAQIGIAGDLETQARIHNITANLGNVNIKANDDVKLNGERVLVNC